MVKNTERKSTWERIAFFFHHPYLAWIILVIFLTLTLLTSFLSYYYSSNIAKQRFQFRTDEIAKAIEFRMLYYEQALRGGIGLFEAQDSVSRSAFQTYVNSLQIEEHLPGIQGIGYSVPVKGNYLEQHISQIKAEGFPEYEVKPEGEREIYSAIIYLEPFDWRNKRAFGYDMWSNEMRRKAMRRAMLSGEAANSGIITLVQETEEDVQRGFLMYLPVYEKGKPLTNEVEREKAFKGWVYSPFRAGDLMNGILNEWDLEYEIEVFDGDTPSQESLLFDSDSIFHFKSDHFNPDFEQIVPLSLQGRNWMLYAYSASNTYRKQSSILPFLIAAFGIIISLVLFLVIYSLYWLQERSISLSDELAFQKVELEKANQELTQFAYIASHDLQEPLRTVSNFSEILHEEYADLIGIEGNRFIRTIQSATTRMSQLIQAILEYSRIGKLGGKQETINVNQLLDEIIADISQLVNENNASLIYGELPLIMGDKSMLRQVFSNLIANAIKYRKKEVNPIIHIEGKESKTHFEFFIRDNGIGIEPQFQKRIFEIFQRLHNKTRYSGTGIGLSFCKKIVNLHQGEISVSSIAGEGSTFHFTIKKINNG